MREVAQIEAIKYALRQSKDGTVVSFVIHPEDLDPELQCLPIGARVMLGWYAVGDDEKPVAENAATTAAKPAENKPKRKFHELPLAQQCAIRCEDALFQAYLANVEPDAWAYFSEIDTQRRLTPGDRAAYVMRKVLGVDSRAELGRNRDADNRWRALEMEYQAWLTDQKYADSRR